MAERTLELRLSFDEEQALSKLIAHVCNYDTKGVLEHVFPAARGAHEREMIGRINGALNAVR